jgi:hypothetical protein
VIVVVVLACAGGAWWVLAGPPAGGKVVDNANVAGGIAGLLALLVTVVVLWPRATRRDAAAVATGQATSALGYLAGETVRFWRVQAKDRRITTPSPAAVRWGWASAEVAVAAAELPARTQVLTAGVVTRLREQLYNRLDADRGRIVLLGAAGAGKTAAMLLLLVDVLEHRAPGCADPVPVWLTMGGWDPDTTPLQDWAAATMTRDYPGLAAAEHGGSGSAAELVRTGRIALFLDGLDEMPSAVQGRALQVIDRDTAGLRVVLTSRPEEYRDAVAQGRLYGAAVVELLPVGVDQAAEFLLAEQLGERRGDWRHVVDALREQPDSVAARALTTPLALSLARDAYATGSPRELLDTARHPTPDALLRHLLTRSLVLAYPDEAERAHATRWLSWIARRMGTDRDLRWWDIVSWTPRWKLKLGTGLVFGVVTALPVALAIGWLGGAPVGVVAGAVVWASSVLKGMDEPFLFAVRWPGRRDVPHMVVTGLIGIVPMVALGLVAGLAETALGPANGLTAGVVFGLVFGLVGGLVDVWATPLATARAASAVEVYRTDLRCTLAVGLVAGLPSGLAGLVFGLPGLVTGSAKAAVGVAGLVLGLAVGFVGGFGPALRLTVVEVLWGLRLRRVRFMPLLQAALHRQVLRQAGAVYQFRHAALQDLLAAGAAPPARRTSRCPSPHR